MFSPQRHERLAVVPLLLFALSSVEAPLAAQHLTFDLREQAAEADIIVVGTVSSVHEVAATEVTVGNQMLPAKVVDAQVHVVRTLKGGDTNKQLDVQFTVPISPAGSVGYGTIQAHTCRILFLRGAGDHLVFANRANPSLPAICEVQPRTSNDAVAAVINEAAAVLDSGQVSEPVKLTLIYRLGSTPTMAATNVLRPHLEGPNPTIRAGVVAALLQHQYLPALTVAQELLMKRPNSVPQYLFVNLSSAIGRYVKDERAIPMLSVLAAVPDPTTRRAATLALRNTGSNRAIRALTLALGDADPEVRYYAVIGLGEIAQQPEWRPLEEDFMTNQKKYLDHWRAWAAVNSPPTDRNR